MTVHMSAMVWKRVTDILQWHFICRKYERHVLQPRRADTSENAGVKRHNITQLSPFSSATQ